jgi:hypothetical protein
MTHISTNIVEFNPKNRASVSQPTALAALGTTVRAELVAMVHATTTVLEHAFAVGDALNQAKGLAGHGNWLNWLASETGLSDRTAQAYMRLANHREQFKANPQRVADMSIRAALRSIGSGVSARTPRPASPLSLADWRAASKAQREAFVAGIKLKEWLAVIPAPWRLQITDWIDGQRASLASGVGRTH